MKKRGRKKFVIDWQKVDKSLRAGANGVQVAAKLGIHYDTLVNTFKIDFSEEKYSNFSDYIQEKRQEGNEILLQKQFELACEGDKMMLIWLGKNRLEQSDKKETTQKNIGSLININMTETGIKPIQSENEIKE
jgi:hypothetical protein